VSERARERARLTHLLAVGLGLRGHPAFRRSPIRVGGRAALWVARCLAQRGTTIELGSHGACLRLPPYLLHNGAGGVFVLREDYEPELRWFERALGDGMVVIDGGANLGIYTVLASRLVGAAGRVLSFEPGAGSFVHLERNIALNRASNVSAINKALSDRCGTALLYHNLGWPIAYALAADDGAATAYEEVETTTIDAEVQGAGLGRVDLIKLDVEGAEEAALHGAHETLRRHRPTVLFELNPLAPIEAGRSHYDAWKLLDGLGYELWGVTEAGDLGRRSVPQLGNNIALCA
jgi:FkbM family methyltransferase